MEEREMVFSPLLQDHVLEKSTSWKMPMLAISHHAASIALQQSFRMKGASHTLTRASSAATSSSMGSAAAPFEALAALDATRADAM
jgi:hypothetical protein